MSDCGCHDDIEPKNQRNLLITLLVINGVMFLVVLHGSYQIIREALSARITAKTNVHSGLS